LLALGSLTRKGALQQHAAPPAGEGSWQRHSHQPYRLAGPFVHEVVEVLLRDQKHSVAAFLGSGTYIAHDLHSTVEPAAHGPLADVQHLSDFRNAIYAQPFRWLMPSALRLL